MKTNFYRRWIPQELSEISVEKRGSEEHVIRGYAAVYDVQTGDVFRQASGFSEVMEVGFFRNAVNSDSILALFNHDVNFVLGKRSAGTLEIGEDAIGLPFEAKYPDTEIIRSLVIEPIRRGEIEGCSWEGFADVDAISYDRRRDVVVLSAGGCTMIRNVGPVTEPAYTDTEVMARSVDFYRQLKQPEKTPDKHIYNRRALELLRLKHEMRYEK